jgi:hypothetical protein
VEFSLEPAGMLFPHSHASSVRMTQKTMIATSFPTMFLIFAVGSGLVVSYVLLVHKFLGKAK